MDKENQIIIKENGRVINQPAKTDFKSTKGEVAATLNESDEPIDYIEKISNIEEVGTKKINKKSPLKPVFFAVFSAIIIGSIISVAMFQFLLDVNQSKGEEATTVPVIGQNVDEKKDSKNEKNNTSTNTTAYQFEPLQGYVLQAGFFSELENAEKWAENLGVSSVIWERENQYFLFVGITETKEEATMIAKSLNSNENIDVFVKEWATIDAEQSLSEGEQKWFETFKENWNENLSNREKFVMESWNELKTDEANKSEWIKPILEHIGKKEISNDLETQQYLLQLMYRYEKVATGN